MVPLYKENHTKDVNFKFKITSICIQVKSSNNHSFKFHALKSHFGNLPFISFILID